MNDILIYIGNTIRQHRLSKKLSTQELAELLSVSPALINNIENARTDTFNLEFMYKLCDTLEISILQLILNKRENIQDALSDLDSINTQSMPSSPSDDVHLIKQNLDIIIKSYISAISSLGYNMNKVSKLTAKLLYEIDYAKSFNNN
jgi:transcriptional regulator with XRE-family HTH domain